MTWFLNLCFNLDCSNFVLSLSKVTSPISVDLHELLHALFLKLAPWRGSKIALILRMSALSSISITITIHVFATTFHYVVLTIRII